MKGVGSFIVGVIAMFPLALVVMWAFLSGLADEIDRQAAIQIRNDKAMLLKVPHMHYRGRPVRDCQISDGRVECDYIDVVGTRQTMVADK